MRRAPIVLAATVLGSAGVLLFKPLPVSSVEPAGSPIAAPSASAPSTSGSTPGTESPSSGASSSSAPATTATDGTYTGTAETVRYGTTQVKVTVAGGKITNVVVVEENQNDQRSVQISESAFPTLEQEVLAKQTAAVDTVSGATYTSDQYEASLQSALDQAHYTAPDGSTASTDVSNIQESGGGFGR